MRQYLQNSTIVETHTNHNKKKLHPNIDWRLSNKIVELSRMDVKFDTFYFILYVRAWENERCAECVWCERGDYRVILSPFE